MTYCSEMDQELRQAVLDAASRAEVAAAVSEIYRELAARIQQRQPLCQLSGRCCRFEEYGHRLYVTTLELSAFYAGLAPTTPLSTNPGGCPFQAEKLCGVHPIRPFGCRIFFCDPTAAQWQEEQYQAFHERLKRLHDELGVPYFYLEWRHALAALGLTPAAEGK